MWVSSTPNDRNSQDITLPPFVITIRTDASLHTAGAGAQPAMTRQPGTLGVEEAALHINCLVPKAAILALKVFMRVGMQPQGLGRHPPRHILLEMDNKTAAVYVNRRVALGHHLCPY